MERGSDKWTDILVGNSMHNNIVDTGTARPRESSIEERRWIGIMCKYELVYCFIYRVRRYTWLEATAISEPRSRKTRKPLP